MNQSNNDVNENLIDVTEYIPQRKCNYRDLLYSVCLFMNSLLFYGLGLVFLLTRIPWSSWI